VGQIGPAALALRGWLEQRFGAPVAEAEPARENASGFDSAIGYVRFAGPQLPPEWCAPLVLRIKPDPERLPEAERERDVHEWLVRHGYPAPRILAVFGPGELSDSPAQVMERADGDGMLDRVRRRPWLLREQIRSLARAQVQLHRLPVDGFPVGDDLLDRRLALVRRTAGALDHGPLTDALHRVEALGDGLREGPQSVCHGDFHPLNVLVGERGVCVIDWTDAGVGDRHGDAARTLLLFELAHVAAGSPAEARVLRVVGPRLSRSYRRAYQREMPLDERRIARWTPVHLLHGWSQAVALHAGLFDRDDPEDDRTDRVPPAMIDELHARFDAALALAG
jgi:aminoglycoside phosphotransferase (APT) family kinase protein